MFQYSSMLHSCDKRLSLLYLLFEQTRVVLRNTSDLYQFNLGIFFLALISRGRRFLHKSHKSFKLTMTKPLMICTPAYKTSSQLHEHLYANIGCALENLLVPRYLTQSPKRKTALSQEKKSVKFWLVLCPQDFSRGSVRHVQSV